MKFCWLRPRPGKAWHEILEAVIKRAPEPKGEISRPLRALIFDSVFDEYKGVIAYARIFDGRIKSGEKISFSASQKETEALEVGIFTPGYKSTGNLSAGEIGYIATGLKEVRDCRVGDTITFKKQPGAGALRAISEVKPMVFAGFFPKEGNNYQQLREAVEKLKLSDAAFIFEPTKSQALGLGFRCGFLGLLHLEITQERLKREYGLDLIVTVPSVAYQVVKKSGETITVNNPEDLPDPSQLAKRG